MSPGPGDPLGAIRYITLDPAAQHSIGDFVVRSDVPLPIEIDASPEELAAAGVSWEAIISAMLKILAYDRDHPDTQYFREFVLAVRPDIDAELTQAAVAKTRGRAVDLAIEVFLSLEGLFPRNARHAVNLAVAYEERSRQHREIGRDEEAERDTELAFRSYRRALTTDPDLPDAHLYFANFHFRQQSFEKAHAELQAYLALEPADGAKKREAAFLLREIEARNLMDELFKAAYDFIRMGQEERGIAKITQFLDANPGVWNGWFLLGWANRRLRRYGEARTAFRKALVLGERNTDIYNELAICEMELGDLRSARGLLHEALALDTENVKVLSNLAVLSLREGKSTDARTYFQLVLDIDPEDPVARAALATLAGQAGKDVATPPEL